MQGLARQETLDALRSRIQSIEMRPLLAEPAPLAADREAVALPAGMLHEIFTDTRRNAGAVLGFALGAARSLVTTARPAIVYLQLSNETAETGLPYAPGLASFGIDPNIVVLIRAQTIIELLWAAEEALACRAVAAVIADIGTDPRALDFTASRRLAMRAADAGGTFLLLRYGLGRTATAARLRWHMAPEISAEAAFDPNAPGQSRWRLTLEKGAWRGRPNTAWLLGWTKNGFDTLGSPNTRRAPAATPVSRPFPAVLGDRLSQTA